MSYNPPQYLPEQHMPPESMYSANPEYVNNQDRSQIPDAADKIDEKQEQLQETMRLQRIQTEESSMIPQQYNFQGPMPLQLKYAFRPGQKPSFPAVGDPDFDGRRLRRTTMRKTVDYNSAIIKELEVIMQPRINVLVCRILRLPSKSNHFSMETYCTIFSKKKIIRTCSSIYRRR